MFPLICCEHGFGLYLSFVHTSSFEPAQATKMLISVLLKKVKMIIKMHGGPRFNKHHTCKFCGEHAGHTMITCPARLHPETHQPKADSRVIPKNPVESWNR
eukprot:g74718.t1